MAPTSTAGAGPLRGDVHITAGMEMLQDAYLHAVAAAAGCVLAKPNLGLS
jgi:hypothetical protein